MDRDAENPGGAQQAGTALKKFTETGKEENPMAATRLIAMHQNKGKSIAQCLKDRTDYAKNGEETEDGELTSSPATRRLLIRNSFFQSRNIIGSLVGRSQATSSRIRSGSLSSLEKSPLGKRTGLVMKPRCGSPKETMPL